VPAGVPASAVAEAGDVPDEDLVRDEWVPVRAKGWRPGDPLPVRRLPLTPQRGRCERDLKQATYRLVSPAGGSTGGGGSMMMVVVSIFVVSGA
jgi:hypothetical protein